MRAEDRTDWALLREYVNHRSEAAFTLLVERHMKRVYGTCLRDLQDAALAEDVTQHVFLLLARKASTFTPSVSLPLWLSHAARLAARDARKGEVRRRRREEEFAQILEGQADRDSDWEGMKGWINDALASLPLMDRQIVLLRYVEGLSLHEIADQLGTTEGAASKRIYRALEKVRLRLNRDLPLLNLVVGGLLARKIETETSSAAHQIARNVIRQAELPSASALSTAIQNPYVKKGLYLLMEAGKKTVIACVSVFFLGVGVLVPAALWKSQRTQAFAHTFIDSAPGGDKVSEKATRAMIDKNYQDRLARVNSGDPTGFLAFVAPDFVFYDPHGGSRSLASLNRRQGAGAPMTAAITVESFAVDGDSALVTYRLRTDVSPPKPTGEAIGHRVEETLLEDRWEKRGGQWVNVVQRRLKDNQT